MTEHRQSLHPIAVVDHVLGEYEDYLRTEFRARDEKLRAALDEALRNKRFLAQEAFFQAHRPFKEGLAWRDLGLDAGLAKVMEERSKSKTAYLHQSEGIRNLLSPDARPLVVTTGTGSGKTECFLLPVIQNAIEDATRLKRNGLTAILVYPMNALANDQEERIKDYLAASGHTYLSVKRYDRTTKQDEREALRRNPPHILLTNYMMLEYLLVRPADRDAVFKNHRCRFIVLDEIHTYRGALGANIALLIRRLKAHLEAAEQDWQAEDRTDRRRFPSLVPVGTSATIKSVDETGRTPEEVRRLRDEAVQGFVSRVTGAKGEDILVLGEEIRDLVYPPEARWAASPATTDVPDFTDAEAVRRALATLCDGSSRESVQSLARRSRVLWWLSDVLARRPMSLTQLAARATTEVPERMGVDEEALRRELEVALVVGAALPEDCEGGLRLRAHRFVRGGWEFHRCVDPNCGKLFPMGQDRCECGKRTAPLYICRSCGADTLRFRWNPETDGTLLTPNTSRTNEHEWMLYDVERLPVNEDDLVEEMRGRPVEHGSFDSENCLFSPDAETYTRKVTLAPARNRCLCCGAFAGAGNIVTAVALGTSAAVRVLGEGVLEALALQHEGDVTRKDKKERLLIFADSRQDAAHQARFITYSGRFDRMRRRVVAILDKEKEPLPIGRLVERLMSEGARHQDNEHVIGYDPELPLPRHVREKAECWEEAILLDDLAVSAGYRATIFNLGLAGVQYENLGELVAKKGSVLREELGISTEALVHLCRCLLDEIRMRWALSRPMLSYHYDNENCPKEFREDAKWERRTTQPNGYACTEMGEPVGWLDPDSIPQGIRLNNLWRRKGAGGRGPSVERKFRHLLKRLGSHLDGETLTEGHLLAVIRMLVEVKLLTPAKLFGYRRSRPLLQVNADSVLVGALSQKDRYRCTVCNVRVPYSFEGAPCPNCHGHMSQWSDQEVLTNRYAKRIRSVSFLPLFAGEHTAQVTGEERIKLEENFKGTIEKSPINVLACSPTLEMGIDVGGLDAVVMRNAPPRPDNYAQRGGRAGRRSRVGVVMGYTRNTPHDGYFFDRPQEMIAGEVPAPAVGLGNRDVVLRHLNAICFGLASPGLAGQMFAYIDLHGKLREEAVQELLDSLERTFPEATRLALRAWGPDILQAVGLDSPERVSEALRLQRARIRTTLERVSRQIVDLQQLIDRWYQFGQARQAAIFADELKRRLLGLRDENKTGEEADDRTAGHPMRRLAEFGILPGYEFPSEPASLRLMRDSHEEEPVSVERRFGLAQFQPDAPVHARGHKWRVVGLDLSSPWNPKTEAPTWLYSVCPTCEQRYHQDHSACPRCGTHNGTAKPLPSYEFGGFLARRDDTPVLEEEDRHAIQSRLRCYPQHNRPVNGRLRLPTGWLVELRSNEEIRWVNEADAPSPTEVKLGICMHSSARGFDICPSCGRILKRPVEAKASGKGRKKVHRQGATEDPYGHAKGCQLVGREPVPVAISCRTEANTLRIRVVLPADFSQEDYSRWGHSLGASLLAGIKHLYMLDGNEVEYELEPFWKVKGTGADHQQGVLTFIDSAVGGSGFLERAAQELHLVAARAIEHLDHKGCESGCYRCLKTYRNQRFHQFLNWPSVIADLEVIATAIPVVEPLNRDDADDPTPWLEAYAAGVGSPLELRFLRLLESRGIRVDRQVEVAADPGGAVLSIADFRVAGTNILIYVDGAAFHKGARLRRDRAIRSRLREGACVWKVLELTSHHLGDLEWLKEIQAHA